MEKSLLHAIAQLPENEQTEEQVKRLQVIVDDTAEFRGQHGPN